MTSIAKATLTTVRTIDVSHLNDAQVASIMTLIDDISKIDIQLAKDATAIKHVIKGLDDGLVKLKARGRAFNPTELDEVRDALRIAIRNEGLDPKQLGLQDFRKFNGNDPSTW